MLCTSGERARSAARSAEQRSAENMGAVRSGAAGLGARRKAGQETAEDGRRRAEDRRRTAEDGGRKTESKRSRVSLQGGAERRRCGRRRSEEGIEMLTHFATKEARGATGGTVVPLTRAESLAQLRRAALPRNRDCARRWRRLNCPFRFSRNQHPTTRLK